MKTTYDSGKAASVPAGYAATTFDGEPWFDGRKIPEVSNSQIADALIGAGVAGASHNNGRVRNLELYHLFLEDIRQKAATQAVAKFLVEKRVS